MSRERAAEIGGVNPELLKEKAHSSQAEGGVGTGRDRLEVFKTGVKETS